MAGRFAALIQRIRPPSDACNRFPPDIIQQAIWLYLRFTLSFRDVEELLAERGIDVSHETIRRWVAVFGPMIARRLRAMRPSPTQPGTSMRCSSRLVARDVSVAGRRCRRRGARLSGAIAPEQASRTAIDAQAR